MQQSNAMLSQRESYVPTMWNKFLWWLATAEEELITDCVIDRNRYAIIGYTVLSTWLFASLAWMYFFSLVVSNPFASIALGLFMGFIILGIDRALIKGITGNNKRKLLPLLFRLILAATIGTFMAQPALLYLFNKEVNQQISLDNEGRRKQKLQQQEAAYTLQKQEWQGKKDVLQNQLNTKYAEVAKARENFIAETDCTGGSKKIGLEAIAKTKKQAYELLLNNYNQLQQQLQPQINIADSALLNIEQTIQKEQIAYTQLFNTGFLTQIEALNNLIKTNTALQYRYYLLLTLLMLIELMPVIAKTLLPSGTYDKKVIAREMIEETILQNNQQHETELKELYNNLAFEADKKFIQTYFDSTTNKRNQLLQQEVDEWNNANNKTYDNFWNQVKQNLLTKQEN
jgi:hypothetical protein